ncbi:NUDIX domain-containing protein [Streptomyces sp. NPDC002690]
MAYARADWSAHFSEGRGFARLGEDEKRLLAEHVPAPEGGGRALDACCGTGELAVFLASSGYTVDGADFAEGALERARTEHAGVPGVRWLHLDIEHDDLAGLHEDGYDLVTFRLSVAFLRDRSRVLRALGARLRAGGALVVVTPLADDTPGEQRATALDEDELSLLADGFEENARFDAGGLAFLVLRRPGGTYAATEKGVPAPQAVVGAAVVVTDPSGRVLLGRSTRGMWELPGGRVETGEAVPATAVRELAEETGLSAREEDAHVLAVLHDDRADVRRITFVVRVTGWGGELGLPEPHRFTRWEWHDPHTLPTLGRLFAPSAQTLHAVWPGVLPGLVPVHTYPCAPAVPLAPAQPLRPAEPVPAAARPLSPTETGASMTTTTSPSGPAELPGPALSDEEYGALRASAALWAGTSVLITNRLGQVLVQSVDYRATRLLPGGAVDRGESPAHAAARELMEELGVVAVVDRGLAVDWVSADTVGAPAIMRFPGELLHVFDGGTWDEGRIAEIRLPDSEITGIEFVEPARLPDLLSPHDARRALAALRARINGSGTVLLENGRPLAPTVLDRLAVLGTARAEERHPWRPSTTPPRLHAAEARGWLFAPDGRVLVLLDPATGAARLPGAGSAAQDGGDPVATLRRGAGDEAAARIGTPLLLGHLTAPAGQPGRLRYAATLDGVGPAPTGQAAGPVHTRVLATPEQAAELFDWGPPAAEQLASVHRARRRLGLPEAARRPVTELTGPTDW